MSSSLFSAVSAVGSREYSTRSVGCRNGMITTNFGDFVVVFLTPISPFLRYVFPPQAQKVQPPL